MNARTARLYVHAGSKPQAVDDLTAIGVVLAEWQIERKELPDVDGEMKRYRGRLAEKLGRVSYRSGSRNRVLSQQCRLLIQSLLLADANNFRDAGDCLGHQRALMTWTPGGKLQFASLPQRLVCQAKSLAVVAVMAAVLLVALFYFWNVGRAASTAGRLAEDAVVRQTQRADAADLQFKSERTLKESLQDQTSSLTEQVAQKDRRIRDLEAETKGGVAPPAPRGKPNKLASDSRYLTFQSDPSLLEDVVFQTLFRKEFLIAEEEARADQMLSLLVNAMRVWWVAVRDMRTFSWESCDLLVDKVVDGRFCTQTFTENLIPNLAE